jgi:hypothetical protein
MVNRDAPAAVGCFLQGVFQKQSGEKPEGEDSGKEKPQFFEPAAEMGRGRVGEIEDEVNGESGKSTSCRRDAHIDFI